MAVFNFISLYGNFTTMVSFLKDEFFALNSHILYLNFENASCFELIIGMVNITDIGEGNASCFILNTVYDLKFYTHFLEVL